MTPWEIRGRELANCNCNYGCPCQFGVLPTTGTCEAAVAFEIDKGHYGDVKLDGLRAAGVYKWPGAIHHGNGQMQLVIDDRADPKQRAALEAIMTGADTEEMATMWFVFSKMAPNKHKTLYSRIETTLDPDERVGEVKVDNVFDIQAKPIPNIVSGLPHRIRINLTQGFEFIQAEMASASTKTKGGAIELNHNNNTHAHFAELHMTGSGVVHH